MCFSSKGPAYLTCYKGITIKWQIIVDVSKFGYVSNTLLN